DHLEAWATYVRGSDVDLLIQLAVVHAQFELIHPFKDGNGRIGRLLIPLFLYQKQVLSSPSFYLSEYLELHRDEYYAGLLGISRDGNWDGWVAFSLDAVAEQSRQNSSRVRQMLSLYETMKSEIVEVAHSQYALRALDALFYRPVFQTTDFRERSGIPRQSALPMLRRLREAGIVPSVREASGRRPGILAFPALLKIVEGQTLM
ncbi:MAG TPA: Fic family protein, partial [Tepidiformaceae bacterium]|nr:Fic family protein [Tepidiformaceae bacterium]